MRNAGTYIKDKIVSRYLEKEQITPQTKSSDINVLLNRVKLDKKKESQKKILFSAVTSLGVILFGILIF